MHKQISLHLGILLVLLLGSSSALAKAIVAVQTYIITNPQKKTERFKRELKILGGKFYEKTYAADGLSDENFRLSIFDGVRAYLCTKSDKKSVGVCQHIRVDVFDPLMTWAVQESIDAKITDFKLSKVAAAIAEKGEMIPCYKVEYTVEVPRSTGGFDKILWQGQHCYKRMLMFQKRLKAYFTALTDLKKIPASAGHLKEYRKWRAMGFPWSSDVEIKSSGLSFFPVGNSSFKVVTTTMDFNRKISGVDFKVPDGFATLESGNTFQDVKIRKVPKK